MYSMVFGDARRLQAAPDLSSRLHRPHPTTEPVAIRPHSHIHVRTGSGHPRRWNCVLPRLRPMRQTSDHTHQPCSPLSRSRHPGTTLHGSRRLRGELEQGLHPASRRRHRRSPRSRPQPLGWLLRPRRDPRPKSRLLRLPNRDRHPGIRLLEAPLRRDDPGRDHADHQRQPLNLCRLGGTRMSSRQHVCFPERRVGCYSDAVLLLPLGQNLEQEHPRIANVRSAWSEISSISHFNRPCR